MENDNTGDNVNFKSYKREIKRNKAFNGERQNARTSTLRSGDSLVLFEVRRKTKFRFPKPKK